MENLKSALFRLGLQDVAKSLVVVLLIVILGAIQQAFMGFGLHVFSYDWSGIVGTALTAEIAYLIKNFLSDDSGKFLGMVG